MISRLSVSIAALFMAASMGARAEYPAKPITLIVPYQPGGASDRIARMLAPKISEFLSGTVIVENKGGADGSIAMTVVANAKPDGYTVLLGDSGQLAINPAIHKVSYDPGKLTGVGPIISFPQVLAVNPNLGIKSLSDLVQLSKSRPGGLDAASATAMGKIGFEMLKKSTGVNLTVVPFSGAAPAMQSVVSGQTSLFLGVPIALKPFLDAGQLKALAVAGPARSPMLPDVATLDELKIPDLYIEATVGLFVPRGTPRDVINQLNMALTQALNEPALKQGLGSMGGTLPVERDVEAFTEKTMRERSRWQKLAINSGIAEKQ